MPEDSPPKIEEGWITAAEAIALLQPIFSRGLEARQAILDWAGALDLPARCRLYVIEEPGKAADKEENGGVPGWFWQCFRDTRQREEERWPTGDFAVVRANGRDSFTYYRAFGVRFNEAKLRENAGLPKGPSGFPSWVTKEGDQSKSPPPIAKPRESGPRVSDSDLRKWADLYLSLIPLPHDTLPNAEASAKAFFPGRSVGRDRVRELLKGRKRGPKGEGE